MPQAATTTTSRIPAARGATPDVRFSRGSRAAAIAQANGIPSWDAETCSFKFVLASETPCRSYRWSSDEWDVVEVDEVLSMRGIQDVDLLLGAPILNMHFSYSLQAVIGVIEEARVEGTQLVCRGRLWDRPDLADIVDGISKGILRNMSVGFDRTQEINEERTGQCPLVTVTGWQPAEASVVAVPADPTAQTRQAVAKPNAAPFAGPPTPPSRGPRPWPRTPAPSAPPPLAPRPTRPKPTSPPPRRPCPRPRRPSRPDGLRTVPGRGHLACRDGRPSRPFF